MRFKLYQVLTLLSILAVALVYMQVLSTIKSTYLPHTLHLSTSTINTATVTIATTSTNTTPMANSTESNATYGYPYIYGYFYEPATMKIKIPANAIVTINTEYLHNYTNYSICVRVNFTCVTAIPLRVPSYLVTTISVHPQELLISLSYRYLPPPVTILSILAIVTLLLVILHITILTSWLNTI